MRPHPLQNLVGGWAGRGAEDVVIGVEDEFPASIGRAGFFKPAAHE